MEPGRIEGSWGITPVPERLRVLGGLEVGLLWGNLGVSLLVVVAGAALVPALSLPDALLAIFVGCVLGNLMLATAGAIGADARVPGMVLLRAPLGRRGSYLPTTANVLQGLGWSIFELLIIATAAAALSDELFGFRAQWLWTLVFGGVALALALLGPIGFVRRFIRRVAVWAVPVALVYLTWWALDGADLGALWDAPGEGGLSVWQGADIVVAITVSFTPYAADYTRFAKSRKGAFFGTGLGYLVPDA
jgi:nucleobase:cation symporter-1, NCS1 family